MRGDRLRRAQAPKVHGLAVLLLAALGKVKHAQRLARVAVFHHTIDQHRQVVKLLLKPCPNRFLGQSHGRLLRQGASTIHRGPRLIALGLWGDA